ncbi:Aste57867_18414 [Aphanomyces stellatus]|uniref:Aste57867_18414 protein n=1 Tax=Aphanomyces stellatus TaxID=120398 RepID=A0A485LAW5_9STRA|nr:hypothetical protein As57867_018352 [Aphanomyces stellatus]VFT95150.1 Aste57867_18414 [Aphanomyces stellatus]
MHLTNILLIAIGLVLAGADGYEDDDSYDAPDATPPIDDASGVDTSAATTTSPSFVDTDAATTVASMSASSARPPCDPAQPGKDSFGYDIAHVPATSDDACKEACYAHPGCGGVTLADDVCYLKSEVNNVTTKANCVTYACPH